MTEVDALGAYTPTEEVEKVDGIPISELWSLDMTLTDYILPRLKAFKNMRRVGYPILDGFNDDDDDDNGQIAEWEIRLDKMIAGFEALLRLTDLIEESDAAIKSQKILDEGMALFGQHYTDLWD